MRCLTCYSVLGSRLRGSDMMVYLLYMIQGNNFRNPSELCEPD